MEEHSLKMLNPKKRKQIEAEFRQAVAEDIHNLEILRTHCKRKVTDSKRSQRRYKNDLLDSLPVSEHIPGIFLIHERQMGYIFVARMSIITT